MVSTLLQMALVMMAGMAWRLFRPLGLTAEQCRKVLTTLVYYLLLPAMILDVLWQAEIGRQSFNYIILAVTSVLLAMAAYGLFGRLFGIAPKRAGAMLLAAAFPNITYLGLPVLEQSLGSWSRSIVIQLDLFAVSPLLFTLGIVAVRHYGEDSSSHKKPLWTLLNAPPFWAAGLAVALNAYDISAPLWFTGALRLLGNAVVPLMLLSLGLALDLKAIKLKYIADILPVIAIKMALLPGFAVLLADRLDMANPHKMAVVLDLAMPSMMLGIVFCDRYRLDSALYATAVTVTTLLSLVSLPLWYDFLMMRYR